MAKKGLAFSEDAFQCTSPKIALEITKMITFFLKLPKMYSQMTYDQKF